MAFARQTNPGPVAGQGARSPRPWDIRDASRRPAPVVVETLGTTCRPPGSLLEATDEPAGSPLLVGSCVGGFRVAERGEDIASITFDDPAECPAFSSLRNDAEAARSRVTTKLRLVTVSPPVLTFVRVGRGDGGGRPPSRRRALSLRRRSAAGVLAPVSRSASVQRGWDGARPATSLA
jgi:hypothetical protein